MSLFLRGVVMIFALVIYTIPVLATTSPLGPGMSKAVQASFAEKVLRVVYDVPAHGGTAAANKLGKFLPAKAMVTQSFFYTVTAFTGTGTVALSCEDANNLYTATDISGITAGTITAGASTGSAATMVKNIAAPCEVTATVTGATATAGRLILYIRYVLGE